MKKSLLVTYGLLIVLTITTALISNSTSFSNVAVALILGLSGMKFLLVAFQFMELKKANSAWKYTLIIVLTLIISLVLLIF